MKIQDVYNSINETLDNPLPFTKLSPTRYVIELGQERLLVVLYSAKVDQYNCLAVSFVNPNSDTPMAMTNYFNGPGAVRVLSTVVSIVDQVGFDVVIFTPDDIDVLIENKKVRLYRIILNKMQRLGKISSHEQLTLPEFDKPILVGMRKVVIDLPTLMGLVKQVGVQKITN